MAITYKIFSEKIGPRWWVVKGYRHYENGETSLLAIDLYNSKYKARERVRDLKLQYWGHE